MNFITIDFSLNSPGICVFNSVAGEYHFISYIKPGTGTKAEQRMQEEISNLEGVTLIKQPDFTKNSEYSNGEMLKIQRYDKMAMDIMGLIAFSIDPKAPIIVAFEGSSYGSSSGTNNIIDMAAGAAILKLRIMEQFQPLSIETVAPTSIKKHAGKGNMKKNELWDVFLDNKLNDINIVDTEFFKYSLNNVGKVSKIPKPFDDLVDAYFLNHYLATKFTTEA